MNLTYAIITICGLLIAGIVGIAVMDPGYITDAPAMPTGVKPTVCTGESTPVCGVDGKNYHNLCMLHVSGVELSYKGECVEELTTEAMATVSEQEPTTEPTTEPTPEVPITSAMPAPPETHMVLLPEGSSILGCEETEECFLPYSLEIWVGDTVSWSNDDAAAHTVTSEGPDAKFDSSLFMSGDIFEFTFDEPGTYPYFCIVHPWMTGEIIVNEVKEMVVITEQPSEEPTLEEPIVEERPSGPVEVIMPHGSGVPGCEETNECFLPYQIEVSSGETVVWTNMDSAAHTVTSGLASNPDGNFDSGMMMVDESWESTFTDSGEYDYYCMLHPWMTGKVIVS